MSGYGARQFVVKSQNKYASFFGWTPAIGHALKFQTVGDAEGYAKKQCVGILTEVESVATEENPMPQVTADYDPFGVRRG